VSRRCVLAEHDRVPRVGGHVRSRRELHGHSAACPADVRTTAGTVCRAVAGGCDVAETCDGSAAECPTDGFASNATTCRASAGVCDVAENCTGTQAQCPANAFKARRASAARRSTRATRRRPVPGRARPAERCLQAGRDSMSRRGRRVRRSGVVLGVEHRVSRRRNAAEHVRLPSRRRPL
jgi:hypothetical protein